MVAALTLKATAEDVLERRGEDGRWKLAEGDSLAMGGGGAHHTGKSLQPPVRSQ